MADITKHNWSDADIFEAVIADDGDSVLIASEFTDNKFRKEDARALAKHFGLLPQWMTRDEFEAGDLGDDLLVAWVWHKGRACRAVVIPRRGRIVYSFLMGVGAWQSECITHVMPINTPEPPK